MGYHHNKSLLLFFMVIFVNTSIFAQTNTKKSNSAYDVSIISKGQGSILCNEKYLVDIDDKKEFTLKNNADVRLSFSPKDGYKLSKFTINGRNQIQDIEKNRITLKGISQKTVIVATFEEANDSVKLTIISGVGGTSYYNGESLTDTKKYTLVKKGTKISLNLNPQKGFKFEKLSVNGILRDVSNNTYSFEIRRNSVIKVSFSESPPENKAIRIEADEKPKFEISVSGPGEANLSGEINGVIAGDPKHPSYPNREDFYVTNGSGVTIKLVPVQNIKSFVIGSIDLTQTVKSSNGIYTVGVTHEFPKFGLTAAFVEFIQRYKVVIMSNEYGSYTPSYELKKTSDYFLIDEGKKGEIELNAKEHYHLEKLIVNGLDQTKKVAFLYNSGTEGGPSYKFDLGEVKNDYKIIATFAPDPKLTIRCDQYGSADRAQSMNDPTQYIYYLDPVYGINPGNSRSFYEPSAAKGSFFDGKPWILRTIAAVGYELAKLTINGEDITSKVKRFAPNSPRNNREIGFISLGFIEKDTKVDITYKKAVQKTPQVDWVDLGTGVKWATRNVGADKARDAGGYYTWNEANALRVQKGRLPTAEEITRLMKECHPNIDKEGDVIGVRFYHRSNRDISIFIPAAGLYAQSEPYKLIDESEGGAIWTSSDAANFLLDLFDTSKVALAFEINTKKIRSMDADKGARLNIRLVMDK